MRDIGNLHSTRDKLARQLDLNPGEEGGVEGIFCMA